ncbi:uncharacterized protein LOC134436980 [Engraulis encrasicolus]|uniref:uncharacterized protein LOC134436980 n=1 Tax=Engraulis encrasicolus TaxID=184585 RepID=UPI002FD32ABB
MPYPALPPPPGAFPPFPFQQRSPPFMDLANPQPPQPSPQRPQLPGAPPGIEVQAREVPGQPGVLYVPSIVAPLVQRSPYLPSMQFDSPVAEETLTEQTDHTLDNDTTQQDVPMEGEVTDYAPTLEGSAVFKALQ